MFFIYRIFKEDDENEYIGSTMNFVKRRSKHKHYCNNPNKHYNYKIYQYIRDHGGWCAWTMELIEESDNRDREIELIKLNKPSLNTVHYDCDKKAKGKEYRENNKESKKEYYENNKEYYKEYQKENYKINKERLNKKYDCECGGKYIYKNKPQHLKTKRHQDYLLQ
jgi:hypothetical protein